MRAIGISVSSAVAGAALAHLSITFGAATVPSRNGFRLVTVIDCGAALVAFTITAFLPRHSTHGTSPPPTATHPGETG